jgi:hypothetical protein
MRLPRPTWLTNFVFVFAMVLSNTGPRDVSIPLSGGNPAKLGFSRETAPDLPSLEDFTRQVSHGTAEAIAGVYAEGVFALPVVNQPAGNPGYVASQPNVLTEFSLAATYGSIGFVAHNTLAGNLFTNLQIGNGLVVIKGNGIQQFYQISRIRRFKALFPNSAYSSYVDLEQGNQLTYSDLFFQTYGVKGTVVLQTCISTDGIDSWGRLFVIATPLQSKDHMPFQLPQGLIASSLLK